MFIILFIIQFNYINIYQNNASLQVVILDVKEAIRKQIITELRILYNSKCAHVVSLMDAYYTEGRQFPQNLFFKICVYIT
jgi:hypothetical protein